MVVYSVNSEVLVDAKGQPFKVVNKGIITIKDIIISKFSLYNFI